MRHLDRQEQLAKGNVEVAVLIKPIQGKQNWGKRHNVHMQALSI